MIMEIIAWRSWVVLAFTLFLFSCNPIEAITDTYGEVVDLVVPEDNDDDLIVGQVIGQATFTSPNAVSVSYIVLNKLGEPVKDDTAVLCSIFSVDDDAFEFQQTETTVSGVVSGCGIGNAGVAESFIASASAGGVSSDPINFTLGPDGT